MNANDIPPPTWPFLLATGLTLVTGVVLWLEAVRVARPLVTLLMVVVGACGGFLVPVLWHANLARLTTVITGIIAGLILGGLLFRITQAVLAGLIAAAIVVGVASFYDGIWTPRALHSLTAVVRMGGGKKIAAAGPADHAAPLPGARPAASTAARTGGNAASTAAGTQTRKVKPTWMWQVVTGVWANIHDRLGKLSAGQRSAMYAMAAGAGLIALLLGIIFSRATSLVGGAWLGTLMIFAALALAGEWYSAKNLAWTVQRLHPTWIFTACGLLGMAVQYRHIHRQKKNKKKDAGEEKK